MKCCKCGNDLPSDSRFCQYCGSDLSDQKRCPFCGTQLQDGMNFCPERGKSVYDTAAAQPAAPNVPAPPPEETAIPAGEDPAAAVSADAATIGPSENQAHPAASWEDLFDCSLNSTFTQYDTVNSVTLFEGSKAIQASSFNADSTFAFDSCKGDSSMLDTRQSVAAYMVLDSLRFLDHVFDAYAAPSGYRFSTSDFGFHI